MLPVSALVLQYRFEIDTLYRIQNIVYSIGYREIQDKIGWFTKLYSFIIRIPFIAFLSNNNIKFNFSPRKGKRSPIQVLREGLTKN